MAISFSTKYRAHLAKINHIDGHIYFAKPNVSKYIYQRVHVLVKHVTNAQKKNMLLGCYCADRYLSCPHPQFPEKIGI